jgi:DNA-binding response OmpR family regulator
VVDDDAGVREVVTIVLRRAGFQVSGAVDGESGWEALRAIPYDLLITDHAMPRLTGLGLLRRVREISAQMPVILMSAKMPWGPTDDWRLLEPGLAIEKPFSLGELLAAVRRTLVSGWGPADSIRRDPVSAGGAAPRAVRSPLPTLPYAQTG